MLSYPRRTGPSKCYPPTRITNYFWHRARFSDQMNWMKANQKVASSLLALGEEDGKLAYSIRVAQVGEETGLFKSLLRHMLSVLF